MSSVTTTIHKWGEEKIYIFINTKNANRFWLQKLLCFFNLLLLNNFSFSVTIPFHLGAWLNETEFFFIYLFVVVCSIKLFKTRSRIYVVGDFFFFFLSYFSTPVCLSNHWLSWVLSSYIYFFSSSLAIKQLFFFCFR